MRASTDSAPPRGLGPTAVFVRRPVLALALNLLIVVAGLAALGGVEVRELPDVDRAVISVRTDYEGASAETIDAQVTSQLEDALAQVPGIVSISSTSSYGSSSITLEFSDTTDLGEAASDVRDLVSRARRQLPDEADDPVVRKSGSDGETVVRLSVTGRVGFDELTRLAEEVVAKELATIEGVAEVSVYGDRRDIMRVTVDPSALASRGLNVQDLREALSDAALDAPSGAVDTATQSIVVRSTAAVTTAEQIAEILVDGSARVRDVAFVQRTYDDATSYVRQNGEPAIGLGVVRQAQSNTLAISQSVRSRMPEIQRLLPEGVTLRISSDDGVFIERSIEEVVLSLLIATGIVAGVIYAFLGTLRATVIPIVTIPVSLIGTVAALWLAGFSINTITLLGLVLATGLVVDDAIVVLENMARHRRAGKGRRAAALIGSREVVFAVLTTTATLAAVFVPISFLPGQAGGLFSEFGFVLAFSVAVSSFTALTLCPMLGAKIDIGASAVPPAPAGFLAQGWRLTSGALTRLCLGAVEACLRAPLVTIATALVFAIWALGLYRSLPQEITPTEDRGFFFAVASAPVGASLDYTDEQIRRAESVLDPYRESGEIETVLSIVGRGESNRAYVIARLSDWESGRRSQQEITFEVNRQLREIPGLSVFARSGNSLGLRSGGRGLRFALTGSDYGELADAADELVDAMERHPAFVNPQVSFDVTRPQLSIDIDRERASGLGVPLQAISETIRTLADSEVATELFLGDEVVEVKMMAGGPAIDDQADLENLFVRTAEGSFVPLSSIVTIREEAAAPSLGREERARAVSVQTNLAEGVDMGRGIKALRALKTEVIGDEARLILLGEAAALEENESGTLAVFAFAALIVLLVLAAQFESVVSALVIMLSVPFGLGAALLAVLTTGGSLNIYSQIGLVMLIGIMAKNGILLVEFANQLREQGQAAGEAIRNAVRLRFRPVMMTMLSTVLGGVPLVLSTGAGAEAREAIGWVIVGGLGISTVFTLLLVPVLYLLLAPVSKPRTHEEARLREELDALEPRPAG
jgi:hydrophobe/amphiphile efflux-1 (HAE1) family protein